MHKIKRNEIKYNVLKVFLENVEKKRRKKRAHDCVLQRNFLIKTHMLQPVICIRVTENTGI